MSGLVHPDQHVRNATQNSLCRAVNRRPGRWACRASNCRRRARFSRTRSSREWKALTNQPRKCRSDTIMARIVAEKSEPSFSQVIHSVGVPRFGEAQVSAWFRVAEYCQQLRFRINPSVRASHPCRRYCGDEGSSRYSQVNRSTLEHNPNGRGCRSDRSQQQPSFKRSRQLDVILRATPCRYSGRCRL